MSMYRDRVAAGRALAVELANYAGRSDTLVLALPRGGVPVAFEIAQKLKLPLDVLVVRKLGAPGQKELAMGAIASGGAVVLNPTVTRYFADDAVDEAVERERSELLRRELAYRNKQPFPKLEGRTIIVVDDGAATGATMRVAVRALHSLHANKIVVALPVAAADAVELLREAADSVVCLYTPQSFEAVGQWYEIFDQVSDQEVLDLLKRARAESPLGAEP